MKTARFIIAAIAWMLMLAAGMQAQDTPAVPLPPTPAFVSARNSPAASEAQLQKLWADLDAVQQKTNALAKDYRSGKISSNELDRNIEENKARMSEIRAAHDREVAANSGSALNLTQLQQLFVIRDRRKYNEALRNEGRITNDEYEERLESLMEEENELIVASGIGQMEYMHIEGDIKNAIGKLWPDFSPGWPAVKIRELLGFTIRQPERTRATSGSESTGKGVRIHLTPLSDEVYDNIKKQIEAGSGKVSERNLNYDSDPVNAHYEYRIGVRSTESANGRPYVIYIKRITSGGGYVNIEILGGDSQ